MFAEEGGESEPGQGGAQWVVGKMLAGLRESSGDRKEVKGKVRSGRREPQGMGSSGGASARPALCASGVRALWIIEQACNGSFMVFREH